MQLSAEVVQFTEYKLRGNWTRFQYIYMQHTIVNTIPSKDFWHHRKVVVYVLFCYVDIFIYLQYLKHRSIEDHAQFFYFRFC